MDNELYTKEQLVRFLAELYDSDIEKTAAGGIFTFKYGKYVVDKYTPTELMKEAHSLNSNVKERYAAELNGAFLIYRYFQNNPCEFNVSCIDVKNTTELFAAYLKNEGKSEATIDRYVRQVPNNEEVRNVVQSVASTEDLFEVVDVSLLFQISAKIASSDFDRKGNNMYSAGLNAYTHFISNLHLLKKHIEKGYNGKGTLTSSLSSKDFPLQTIYYGAPGTGKSYKVKSEKLQGVAEENIFRTTFHPDYDYASFVGCYKPKKEGEKITYSFVPQVFTNAYVKAWNNPDKSVYLVIEEINRGNCAQIFGDLFQLLDRGDNGKSEYPVDADEDLKDYLIQKLGEDSEGIKDGKLCLPPNLNILATMNTSDQSLFPMDSAFKRRWEWEYVPIRYTEAEAKDVNDNFHTFKITIGSNTYKWVKFLAKVNEKILAATYSEDKQMGEYFIKKDIDEKTFINKVMYYLWSEVGKDLYNTPNAFFTLPQDFKDKDGKSKTEFSFNELFKDKATELLAGFMEKLQVKSEEEKEKENSTENFKANDDVSSTED